MRASGPEPAGAAAYARQVKFAHLLSEQYQDELLYVHGIGWHFWDGMRWAIDVDDAVSMRAVMEVLSSEWLDSLGDKDRARSVESCHTAPGVRGILQLAAALEPFSVAADNLDANPYLLNVKNGTLNLQTLILGPHNPADRITKIARAAYDPGAVSEEWNRFLDQVLPDVGVREYLRRFVGASLLGEVREQEFTIALGTGANGKGVCYGAVLHALGDYGHIVESDLFTMTKSNANAASPAKLGLRGRRFVVCSETEREHRLAAALMKNLTGGDPINARPLYGNPVTFTPSHTVLMVTNFLPKVAGNDPAIWRRIRVVPFDVVISEAERDPELGNRLNQASDAILAWAVSGWKNYRELGGMNAPRAVTAATDKYRRGSDAIGRFIDDRCVQGPHLTVAVSDLYDAWLEWATDDGAEPVSKRDLGEELGKRGFEEHRGAKGCRKRKGIKLREEGSDADNLPR